MTRRVLVALDGSKEDEVSILEARRLCHSDAVVHLLHVVPPTYSPVGMDPTHRVDLAAKAEAYLRDVRLRIDVGRGPDLVRAGEPADQIFKAALELSIDVIAMGTHARRGISRMVLGSVAQEVVRRTELPVLLTRPGTSTPPGLRRILVPLDSSETSRTILRTLRPIAHRSGAELVLFHVEERVPDPSPQWAFKGPIAVKPAPGYRLQEIADALETEEDVTCRTLTAHGSPADEILREAREQGADLIAMTTHGRSGLDRTLMGSVAEAVVCGADRAVLVQKPLTRIAPRQEGDAHE